VGWADQQRAAQFKQKVGTHYMTALVENGYITRLLGCGRHWVGKSVVTLDRISQARADL
jgi:hypothetical protein